MKRVLMNQGCYDKYLYKYQTTYLELSDYEPAFRESETETGFLPDFRVGEVNGKRFYALRIWYGMPYRNKHKIKINDLVMCVWA